MKIAALLFLLTAASAHAENPHFPVPSAEAERHLGREDFAILHAKATASGMAGAQRLRLRFADGTELSAKWKAAPRRSGEGWNNVPRKEIAAYAIQRWFLDPDDYVVPTAVARCIPLEVHAAIDASAPPTFEGHPCVYGSLALWIEGVEPVEEVVDLERFAADPVYARHIGDVNLLGILIGHRDRRLSNFLIATPPAEARVFSVDNGIAFGPRVYNFFVRNLDSLRVPALPRRDIERLRAVGEKELAALGVLGELAPDEAGVLVAALPGPNPDPEEGTRRTPSGGVQYGLTEDEIDDVRGHLEDLLAAVDEGEVALR